MSKLKRREFMKSGSLLTATLMTGTAYSNENQIKVEEKSPRILDSIMNRRSVRHYTSTPVPEKHIKMIIEAARMAPTSGNQQPWSDFLISKSQSLNPK